jgi:hypothetical protein
LISSLATRAALPGLSLPRWDVRFHTLRSLKVPPEPLKITISRKSAAPNRRRKLVTSPYSWSDRGNSNIGFAQQGRLYRCVQICIFGDGVQGKGRPSPASAIQKSQRRAHFCFLPSTGNSASAVRKDADEIFCRLPRMEADRGVPRLRVLSPNTRCLKSESRTAGRALLPERILRRRSEYSSEENSL